ncbi:ABC transporter permease subunit [Kitasatospora acidiphila]|uniref:ABC transporter permease subunit n=1 Tax=Kitasatospora acidiphila TaxID=2567942 RepID=UPI0015F0204D|nr:ABC transporter permease subunit [Kitasatospora acidiphila]
MGLVGQLRAGRAGSEAVRGGFQIERAANGRYQWQLKAPNGRIVAVSSPVFETMAEVSRAVEQLRDETAELTARITHVRDGIGWIWVVPGSRGLADARSSRAYERYATCQNAFRRFVALLERQAESQAERRAEAERRAGAQAPESQAHEPQPAEPRASLALTVMMMPIVTRAAEVVIRLVPGTLREASYALGGSQWRTVWNVVLPTARPGLATAVILGMARGIGETSPVLLTAGFTSGMNADPLTGHQVSLPLFIWNCVRQPYPAMVSRGFAAGLTLMLLVLVLFVTARLIGGRRPGELSRRQRRRLARQAAGR